MSVVNEVSWMIGGPQGSGVDSSANLFAQACVAAGLWVFGKREYHSNIKGKHSYFQVRVSSNPIHSHVDDVHILAAFEESTARIHAPEVVSGGALVYDPTKISRDALELKSDILLQPVDYNRMLREVAESAKADYSSLSLMKNTLAVAVSLALLRLDMSFLEEILSRIYTGKKSKLVAPNLAAVEKAYKTVAALPEEARERFPYRLEPLPQSPKRLLINGAIATALGKLKAGCRYQTYYPISPATDESVFLEGKPEYGMAVVQCEDEIAAISMALGAATTGTRASVSTSGPGFSLIQEGLGWAGMNEVPMVVFEYQGAALPPAFPRATNRGTSCSRPSGAMGNTPGL